MIYRHLNNDKNLQLVLENYAQNWKVLETESKTSYAYITIKQTKHRKLIGTTKVFESDFMSPHTEKFCWQRNDAAGDEAAESEVKHSEVLRKKGI